ncbi:MULTISPECIES: hypothetical protein [unclassified Agrococcus]|uniref:DUF7426 family protein n=1 Tax=unclassified Agrococcus TaxID=2615065 RepID=UPI003616C148
MIGDFKQWAQPDLELPYDGRIYRVPAPTVERAKAIIASAIRGEVGLGLVKGPVPPEVQAVLDSIGDSHPALTDEVYAQMDADGVPKESIDRMAYYAVFYWARSEQYADWIGKILWTPREGDASVAGDAARKAASSRRRTSPRTA